MSVLGLSVLSILGCMYFASRESNPSAAHRLFLIVFHLYQLRALPLQSKWFTFTQQVSCLKDKH